MKQLSDAGRTTLKRLEGFRSRAYIPVPDDVPTIGYGTTKGVKMGDTITMAEADKRLIADLFSCETTVWQACKIKPNQNEFDAMVLLCYNIGGPRFRTSTVLKAHNRGDSQSAARAFALFNKSGGKVYVGLTRRRAEESVLYLQPVENPTGAEPVLKMPQSIDAESKMSESPINRAGIVAGGTATIATVSEVVNSVGHLKQGVSDLQDWIVPLLLIVSIGAVGYIVHMRWTQRKGGWA